MPGARVDWTITNQHLIGRDMKLPNQRRTGVQSLGERSPGQPLANANRRAGQVVAEGQANTRLAQERGAMAMQAVDDAHQFVLKLAENEDTQGYFEQVMSFETKAKKSMQELTKNNMVDLNSIYVPETAKAVLKEYEETDDGQGNMVRMAPTYKVGDAIHEARLREYIDIGDKQLNSDKVKDEYRRAIRVTYSNSSEAVFAKGTVDRVNMAKAKTNENFDRAIDGLDAERAGQIAASGLATGAWTSAEYVANMESMGSRIDAKYFTKEILTAETSDELLDIFSTLNNESNNLTAGQQMSLSLAAENRMKKLENGELVGVELDKDARKAKAFYRVDTGDLGIHNLYDGSVASEDIPAMRTAIIQRDRVGSQFSSPLAVSQLERQVAKVQYPEDGMDTAQMAMAADKSLHNAMLSGSISHPKYLQMKEEVQKNIKSNYATPEYKTATSSIQMEVMGMSDEEAEAAAWAALINKDGSTHSAIIELGKMKAKAQQDLQAYIRANGARSKPMEWWDKNKQHYTQDAMSKRATEQFKAQYPGEAIEKPDGTVDVEKTKRKMTIEANTGHMSDFEYARRSKALETDNTIQAVEPVQ